MQCGLPYDQYVSNPDNEAYRVRDTGQPGETELPVLPHWGFEFDWYGLDTGSQVAMFSSAGFGPVPAVVMNHERQLYEWTLQCDSLPDLGECLECPNQPGNYGDWIRMAERGFFTFDCGSGRYERWTVPSRPILFDELPSALSRLARIVALDLAFDDVSTIDLVELGIPVATCPQWS